MEPRKKKKISRRSFIGGGMASIVGAGVGLSAASGPLGAAQESAASETDAQDKPSIKDYRKLGKTGFEVCDISFGNAYMQEPSVLEYAIERGINYVDTARQYFEMERVIGQIFPAKRDKLWVTTKLVPELFTEDVTVEAILTAIDESLERLNTDHIDCCLIHSVGEDPNKADRTRIENPNIPEAFARAKKAGKIRFWGASSHGPRMIEEFTWLIENTDIDMIMPGMNLMTKGLEPVLAMAKKKDIAVVAMKSLSAARKIDYSEYMNEGRTARQALLKWLLAQPNIDTINITMRTFEMVDEYVAASGQKNLGMHEEKVLREYYTRLDRDYCRPGCDGCLGVCPSMVPIHDILRYRLYFNNYGSEKYAMGLYSKLPSSCNATQCSSCAAPCESRCPFRLPIREKLLRAHDELTA